jgi:hypothetical protein
MSRPAADPAAYEAALLFVFAVDSLLTCGTQYRGHIPTAEFYDVDGNLLGDLQQVVEAACRDVLTIPQTQP